MAQNGTHLKAVGGIRSLATHGESRIAVEQLLEPFAKKRMIVHDQDSAFL